MFLVVGIYLREDCMMRMPSLFNAFCRWGLLLNRLDEDVAGVLAAVQFWPYLVAPAPGLEAST